MFTPTALNNGTMQPTVPQLIWQGCAHLALGKEDNMPPCILPEHLFEITGQGLW